MATIDVRKYGAVADGTTDSTSAIQEAVNKQAEVIIQNGIFLISGSIKIPSDRTVYIKNATIKMDDDCYDNIFRNSDFINGNSNIYIKGIGNACIDGNAANNDDDYATYGPSEIYPISTTLYRYQMIVMCGVNNFEISGLNIVDFPHWNITLQNSQNGIVKNIYLNYFTKLANQDGISCVCGTNNITIDNIRGYAEDDIIEMYVGAKTMIGVNIPNWTVGDVHDINVRNINIYKTAYHPFITLGGDGNKIYNINCTDWVVNVCMFFAYFGLTGYYIAPPSKDDVYDITFDNILLKSQTDVGASIRALESCKSISFTNWDNDSGKADYSEGVGKDVVDFTINGVEQSA